MQSILIKIHVRKKRLNLSPELHQKIAIKAALSNESMNEHIEKTLAHDVEDVDSELSILEVK